MITNKIMIGVLLAGILALAFLFSPQIIGTTLALPLKQDTNLSRITIPYSGYLSKDTGQIISEHVYDFSFKLYDAEQGGQLLWSEIQKAVLVKDGSFFTSLGVINPIPSEVVGSTRSWLEVGVQGEGERDFTSLTPRQVLNVVSASQLTSTTTTSTGLTCPHDHAGEVWIANIAWADGVIKVMNYGNGPSIWGWNGGGGNALRGFAQGNGLGVYGESTNNDGILGQASASGKSGVYGNHTSDGFGVTGRSTTGYGGYFDSGNDHYDIVLGGVVGRINTWPDHPNSQLYLSSNADIILKLDNDGGGNNVLRVKNSGGNDVCMIDEAGNLTCIGNKSASVEIDNYGNRLLYAIESPEVWFEDVGSAKLEGGQVFVGFDPIFAETVNLNSDYHIFLTPLSLEPVLLYVTTKDSSGFTVKGVTLDGEPSACTFDYRVIAKRLGYEDLRLPEVEMLTESQEPMEVER